MIILFCDLNFRLDFMIINNGSVIMTGVDLNNRSISAIYKLSAYYDYK